MMFFVKSFKLNNGGSCIRQFIGRYISSISKISTISDIYSLENSGQIKIEGWITSVRKMKDVLFVDVNDGSCSKNLQMIIEKSKVPNGLGYGASVSAAGSLQTNKNKQLEVIVSDIEVLGVCEVKDYPFAPRMKYNSNHQREFIHLRPRTAAFSSLLRIRHKSELLIHNILDEYGFFNIDVPVLTTNDCEGGGEVFVVKPDCNGLIKTMSKEGRNNDRKTDEEIFFGGKTYLTVSGQLHLEAAARSLRNVYSFGPIFRAENSKSRLHLSEFYMLETEMAFINGITDITDMIENFLKRLIDNILNTYSEEVHQHFKYTEINSNKQLDILNKMITERFRVISYKEAFDILDKKRDRFKSRLKIGEAFGKEHELYLVEYNGNVPVFVVEWPDTTKPFYMRSLGQSNKVEAMDLLCMNVGELCGGGVREDSYTTLSQKIKKTNSDTKLDWYLELRKYGNVTTGGFGMGYERFLQLLLGTPNIKDTIPFPRWPHNCNL